MCVTDIVIDWYEHWPYLLRPRMSPNYSDCHQMPVHSLIPRIIIIDGKEKEFSKIVKGENNVLFTETSIVFNEETIICIVAEMAPCAILRLECVPYQYHLSFGVELLQITGRSGFDPRQGQRIFPLASVSRPAQGHTQPPVHWVPLSFPRG
jgi:hypothetical protein